MSYEDDGSVHGHAAIWGSCHRGFLGGQFEQCVTPPRSNTNYEQFHQGYVSTAEGERVAIGKITFDTDHAPLTADAVAASRHYDNTGSVGAYVRATNGRHGIWISGVLREDLAPSAVTALRANPLSGDWRLMNGSLEMVAALAVPVNGFSTPQLALSASVDGGVQTLILPGNCECEEEEEVALMEDMAVRAAVLSKAYQRRKHSLISAMLTAKRRNSLPKSSFAMPGERAYPIHDLAHARNALARSSGKPEEATVRRAVCRRYPALCK
jgi:hypothetical protein